MAKQLIINDENQQIIAAADSITKAADTQAEFYDSALSTKVQNVVLQDRSDLVIGIVGEASSGKFFTLFGMPFNTQLCDFDYNSSSYDMQQLQIIENQLENFNKKMTEEMVGILPRAAEDLIKCQ